MNKIFTLTASGLILMSCISCHDKDRMEIHFTNFPATIRMEPMPLQFHDDEIRVIGSADVVNGQYIFYTYDNPYFMLAADTTLNKLIPFARKGEGPGEITNVWGLTNKLLKNGELSIYDSHTMCVYGCDMDSGYNLTTYHPFPEQFREYAPIHPIELKNGKYIACRGDFRYGTLMYDPADSSVTELPVGIDFDDIDNPVMDNVSLHILEYDADNGLIAEIYSCTPTIILRDTQGNVTAAYTYDGYSRHKKKNGYTADCFGSVCFAAGYMWVLYGDTDEMDESHIFVLGHDGTPVADMLIDPACTFSIDTARHLLIATNPNCDEANVKLYRLPPFLKR